MTEVSEKEEYVFFYNGYLSQFHSSPFTLDSVEYSCCEQAMMHKKALLFEDHIIKLSKVVDWWRCSGRRHLMPER